MAAADAARVAIKTIGAPVAGRLLTPVAGKGAAGEGDGLAAVVGSGEAWTISKLEDLLVL